ncbi:MAG: hypothetical protein KDD14_22955 [Saprospiraceae bacterium]|nr:hypothetical protein [Saprospiraceae bacterium]
MEKNTPTRLWWYGQLTGVLLAGTLLCYALIFLIGGLTEDSTRLAIRWSARFAVVFFCAAFGASAIRRFFKNNFTFWLRMNRKYLGITFAITHLCHLGFLVLLQKQFHPVFTLAKTTSLLAGGTAYFFVVAMLLTSFDTFSKQLTPRQWKVLHTVGGWWIWAIFFNSNLKNVLKYPGYLPLFLLLVGVGVLKVLLYFRKSRIG